MKLILALMVVFFCSNCAIIETIEYQQIERIPVEVQVETNEKEQEPKSWYMPIAEGLGKLIAVEPLVGMFQVVGTTLVDMTGNITGAVSKIRTNTQYKETRVKVFRLFPFYEIDHEKVMKQMKAIIKKEVE